MPPLRIQQRLAIRSMSTNPTVTFHMGEFNKSITVCDAEGVFVEDDQLSEIVQSLNEREIELTEARQALANAQQWIDSEPDWKAKFIEAHEAVKAERDTALAQLDAICGHLRNKDKTLPTPDGVRDRLAAYHSQLAEYQRADELNRINMELGRKALAEMTRERDDYKAKWEESADDSIKCFELSGFIGEGADNKAGEGFFDFLKRTRSERDAMREALEQALPLLQEQHHLIVAAHGHIDWSRNDKILDDIAALLPKEAK